MCLCVCMDGCVRGTSAAPAIPDTSMFRNLQAVRLEGKRFRSDTRNIAGEKKKRERDYPEATGWMGNTQHRRKVALAVVLL